MNILHLNKIRYFLNMMINRYFINTIIIVFFISVYLLPLENSMSTERITSSSYLNNNIRYIHNNLFDGDLNTAWAEGASGDGIGEWVKIEFENIKHINSIGIYNGYIKSQELYKANNRVKDIEVSFDNNRKIIMK